MSANLCVDVVEECSRIHQLWGPDLDYGVIYSELEFENRSVDPIVTTNKSRKNQGLIPKVRGENKRHPDARRNVTLSVRRVAFRSGGAASGRFRSVQADECPRQ